MFEQFRRSFGLDNDGNTERRRPQNINDKVKANNVDKVISETSNKKNLIDVNQCLVVGTFAGILDVIGNLSVFDDRYFECLDLPR